MNHPTNVALLIVMVKYQIAITSPLAILLVITQMIRADATNMGTDGVQLLDASRATKTRNRSENQMELLGFMRWCWLSNKLGNKLLLCVFVG